MLVSAGAILTPAHHLQLTSPVPCPQGISPCYLETTSSLYSASIPSLSHTLAGPRAHKLQLSLKKMAIEEKQVNNVDTFKSCALKEDKMTHFPSCNPIKEETYLLTFFMVQDLPSIARSQSDAAVMQPHQAPCWPQRCEGRHRIDWQQQPCNSLPEKQCHPRLWFAPALPANT